MQDEAHQWKEQNGHENLTNGTDINEAKVSDHTTVPRL